MPTIKPFKAVIYNKEKVKDIAKVVAPPYDVITPAMQESLYRKHENNIVRLILGKIKKTDDESENRYTRAKRFMELWLKANILVYDKKEAVYVYSQKYRYDDKWITRTGFISLMKLEHVDKTKVLPHENTLKEPKADRLNLVRSVKANLSCIFMLYEDDKNEIGGILKNIMAKKRPFIDIRIYNIRNQVWKIPEKDLIKRIEKIMAGKNIFIADGHHRYETAVNYAKEAENSDMPKAIKDSSKYTLAYFCRLDNGSLTILPTHRLIKDIGGLKRSGILEKLKDFFTIEEYASAEKMILRLKEGSSYHVFGMYMGGKKYYALRLKKDYESGAFMGKGSPDWQSLDVSILHLFIIQKILAVRDEDDNIEFVKDERKALRLVDEGKFKIAFLLNPTRVSEVKKVAEQGERMPRKATFFYPKPLSGLVIRKM